VSRRPSFALTAAALLLLTGFAAVPAIAMDSPADPTPAEAPAPTVALDLAFEAGFTARGGEEGVLVWGLFAMAVELPARPDVLHSVTLSLELPAGGLRVAAVASTADSPFLDTIGSTRLVVRGDPAGSPRHTVAYEATYTPFGEEVLLEGSSPASPEKFLGKRVSEAGTGTLLHLGAREYDPATGRFQGLDPILGVAAHPQTQNPYAYATNDPVGNADPNGMCEVVCALAIIAVAAVATAAVAHYGPAKFRLGMDLAATAIGFIPLFGDVFSTAYFLTHDFLDCAEGHCDGVAIGLDTIGIVPGIPNLGGGAHAATAVFRALPPGTPMVGFIPLSIRLTGRAAGQVPPAVIHTSGLQHGNPAHWAKIQDEAAAMAKSGKYSDVYVNKALSTATGGVVPSGLRPDIVGKTWGGKYVVVEVVSPSQTASQMDRKVDAMQLLLGGRYGGRRVIP